MSKTRLPTPTLSLPGIRLPTDVLAPFHLEAGVGPLTGRPSYRAATAFWLPASRRFPRFRSLPRTAIRADRHFLTLPPALWLPAITDHATLKPLWLPANAGNPHVDAPRFAATLLRSRSPAPGAASHRAPRATFHTLFLTRFYSLYSLYYSWCFDFMAKKVEGRISMCG